MIICTSHRDFYQLLNLIITLNRTATIYKLLVENEIDQLVFLLVEMFEELIEPNEILSKALIINNLLDILDVRNHKRPHAQYFEVRSRLIAMLSSLPRINQIPFFKHKINSFEVNMK